MDYFFFIKSFVDDTFLKAKADGKSVDTDCAAKNFQIKLKSDFTDAQFAVLLMT